MLVSDAHLSHKTFAYFIYMNIGLIILHIKSCEGTLKAVPLSDAQFAAVKIGKNE